MEIMVIWKWEFFGPWTFLIVWSWIDWFGTFEIEHLVRKSQFVNQLIYVIVLYPLYVIIEFHVDMIVVVIWELRLFLLSLLCIWSQDLANLGQFGNGTFGSPYTVGLLIGSSVWLLYFLLSRVNVHMEVMAVWWFRTF